MDLPLGVDLERPNAARIYDYFLGGAHHFEADRVAARQLLAVAPHVVDGLRANRSFLMRAVRHCAARGITQFLDLGSGIPTMGNVHHVARAHQPGARVAYIDLDAVAVAHSRDLLAGDPALSVTEADLRHVDTVLAAPGVVDLLDLDRPVALLAVAVLHFIPDTDALAAVLARYYRALAPGSMVVVSHGSHDHDDPGLAARMSAGARTYQRSDTPATTRSRTEILRLLAGLDVVAPGLVDVTAWEADPADQAPAGAYGAVAVRP